MSRVAAFACCGVVTGGIVGAILGDGKHFTEATLFLLPGLFFGPPLGWALWRRGALTPLGMVGFVFAAIGANTAASYAAVAVFKPVTDALARSEFLGLFVVGVIGGTIGGLLHGGASGWLLRSRRWPWLWLAGTVLGLALPLVFVDEHFGLALFYALWQGGYAATLACLPKTARRSGDGYLGVRILRR